MISTKMTNRFLVILALFFCSPICASDVTRDAALAVGVRPPSSAPRFVKRIAWRLEKRFLQLIGLFDPCSPPDSKLSLRVLWWKAMAAGDKSSPVFEKDNITYDCLPTGFRWLVREPLRTILHPRWIHAIIEIRTAYLDQAITRLRNELGPLAKLRLISMGGGYDTRGIRLKISGAVDEAVDLDLPSVIEAKKKMLERLCKRRPKQNISLPLTYAVDLNDGERVTNVLLDILQNRKESSQQWHNVFLFEGVLMYLSEGQPRHLLQICRQVLDQSKENGSIVFADALENIPDDDLGTARSELAKHGWKVVEWLPKGSRTRHMGRVDLLA